jgi:hypothetical protein
MYKLLQIGKFFLRLDIFDKEMPILLGIQTIKAYYRVETLENPDETYLAKVEEMQIGAVLFKIVIGVENKTDYIKELNDLQEFIKGQNSEGGCDTSKKD